VSYSVKNQVAVGVGAGRVEVVGLMVVVGVVGNVVMEVVDDGKGVVQAQTFTV
jgi:hypothetical protein